MQKDRATTDLIDVPRKYIFDTTSFLEGDLYDFIFSEGQKQIFIEAKYPGTIRNYQDNIYEIGSWTISSNIIIPLGDKETRTVGVEAEFLKEITPHQAYEIALKALKKYEREWIEYLQEEAKEISIIEEED
ncbi:MAG: hypothetical protein ACOZF2_10495 [Thermodesulfobacteriota bacterium]